MHRYVLEEWGSRKQGKEGLEEERTGGWEGEGEGDLETSVEGVWGMGAGGEGF